MALKPGQGLAKWELATVRKIVSEHRRRYWVLHFWDHDDLVQDVLLHWIEIRGRTRQSSEAQPPVSFMAKVVRNKLTDLIRELDSDKRAGDVGAMSLESMQEDDDGVHLNAALPTETTDSWESEGVDCRDARIDLSRVLGLLTSTQRELCRLLGEEGLSVTEAARALGLHRSSVYEQVARIRGCLETEGLDAYVTGGR
jgi:RNA polymerase sigma factor (sigma-70 family)